MNKSELTRKELVLQYLQRNMNTWVNGPELANEKVGGSEGLKRVRELREEGHRIVTRPHPDPKRDIWQYKLIVPDEVHPSIQRRLMEEPLAGKETVHAAAPAAAAKPIVRGEPLPLRFDEQTGLYEVTKTVCVECEGLYDDEAEHRESPKHKAYLIKKKRDQDQQEIDVPAQPAQLMFTTMPKTFALGDVTVCPRCLGHKRGPRPEHIKKRGGVVVEIVPARDAEDFTRDPFKPTAKSGEPNRCPRCNGFGIVPTAGI